MVRPTQFLFSNSAQESPVNSPQNLGSITRHGLIGGAVKAFTEKDSAYGELCLSAKQTTEHSPELSQAPDSILKRLDWQCERPVPLLKNLQRLTAPNPGVMTGPGTNTYIVGTALTGYIVIDPGPFDPEHTARILKACNGTIKLIVCTHSHPDHSPGAKPLQALCEKESSFKPPVLGLSSKPTAKPSALFKPDRELIDGECLSLKYEDKIDARISQTHTLKVIFTPGHAANHVCLILEEDGLLFSGDHVLNGSTTIVDPPDGNMGEYLKSLQTLAQCCRERDIEFILPAHGYVLGNYLGRPRSALEVIENLHAHRMKRESKILNVIQDNPSGSMDDWVSKAYDDVPEGIWPIAKRSLLAHIEHLREIDSI